MNRSFFKDVGCFRLTIFKRVSYKHTIKPFAFGHGDERRPDTCPMMFKSAGKTNFSAKNLKEIYHECGPIMR